jgi:DNA polymerase (family 10)
VTPCDVARTFDELATCLEVLAVRPARARTYRDLARRIDRAGPRASAWLTPGVGLPFPAPHWLAEELGELVRSGRFAVLDDARAAVPTDLARLAGAPSIGSALARVLWRKTKAHTLGELADVLRAGFVLPIAGMGPTRRARLEALLPAPRVGMLLGVAVDASRIVEGALKDAGARKVAAVGDVRRGEEIVRALELLATGLAPRANADALRAADEARLVCDVAGTAREVSCTQQGRGPLRIRVCAGDDWPLELLRASGDDAHVAWLETRALAQGGLANVARGAKTEGEIYERLDLCPIAPELRRGITGREPDDLLQRNAVRGAFHAHTDWSDGATTIEAMALEAARAGYEYLGISDHSRSAPYANGLDAARLASQRKAIERARKEVRGLSILHGLEVDILSDGSLDLPDYVLAELDFVIASVHSDTRMPAKAMTARIVRAVSHPLVTILGHPTGRLLSGKGGYAFDVDAVARAAKANDTWIEINANGHRLDLSPALARRAYAHGVRFAIDPDAHTPDGLFDVALGERIARRAGLPAGAIVNTCGRREMLELLKARKRRALRRLGPLS